MHNKIYMCLSYLLSYIPKIDGSRVHEIEVFRTRVVESESVESHVFSWSRFFKTAGVGVGFSKLLESESVFQNCWSRNQESESENLLQLPTPMFIK